MSRPPPQTRKGHEFDLDNFRLAAKRARANTKRARPLNEEIMRILDRLILLYTEEQHGQSAPAPVANAPKKSDVVTKKSA
jgi:hypothetical protein